VGGDDLAVGAEPIGVAPSFLPSSGSVRFDTEFRTTINDARVSGVVRRRLLAGLALGVMLMLSGCATVSVHSDVAGDSSISEYRLNVNTTATVYSLLNDRAESAGYENFSSQLRDGINESNAESVTVDSSISGDEVQLTLVATGYDPVDNENLNVTTEDGSLVYSDTTFYNASQSSDFDSGLASDLEMRYTVEMPGEVETARGADSVNGSEATYTASGPDAFSETQVYVTSEASAVPVPGFGVGVAVVAVLGAALLLRRGRD
jgi:PGF-CTERM protein